jgi:hypothetical protein
MTNEFIKFTHGVGHRNPRVKRKIGLAMKGFRLLSAVTEAVQFQEFSTTDPKIEIFLQIFIRKAMVRFKKNTKEIVVLFMFHVFVA